MSDPNAQICKGLRIFFALLSNRKNEVLVASKKHQVVLK
jgi:hypothetical protein